MKATKSTAYLNKIQAFSEELVIKVLRGLGPEYDASSSSICACEIPITYEELLKNSATVNCSSFTHQSLRCHLLLVLILPSLISVWHKVVDNTWTKIVPTNLEVTGQAIKTTQIQIETPISEIPIILIGALKTPTIEIEFSANCMTNMEILLVFAALAVTIWMRHKLFFHRLLDQPLLIRSWILVHYITLPQILIICRLTLSTQRWVML